ncbi:AEC family transporter [Treponema vincentii]|uniref:Auxin efflux carrier n=2 Tax=Treponema vincentii TaxID=69710 RepID=S3LBD0_9SPIR|nr:AEC family transporter [Treponema vincentii]EEV19139.1 auxin efflux carrier [Treponema vincentii ATCC 35580]EPF46985.1 auxin efflux carrier [Treponema vincentii F0403]UTC60117.1 AEC family transporter [Treponema vincentii]
MVIVDVVKSIMPIIILILIGYLIHQKKRIDDGFNTNVSYLVMNIALPASVFISVTKNLTVAELKTLALPLLIGAAAFVVNYVFAFFLMKVTKIPKGRRGIFVNTIVNANTIFIGMPLNEALFGDAAVKYFLVYYVLNTISTWTIGSILIANDSKADSLSRRKINLKKILSPPIIGFIIAIAVLLSGITIPAMIMATFTYLGNLVTPLSLIYIGVVLSKAGLKSIHFDRDTVTALLGKFILSPLVMAFIIFASAKTGMTIDSVLRRTLIVQTAVPALTVLPILADEGNGDIEYATNVVTTSTILFIVLIPVVMLLLPK